MRRTNALVRLTRTRLPQPADLFTGNWTSRPKFAVSKRTLLHSQLAQNLCCFADNAVQFRPRNRSLHRSIEPCRGELICHALPLCVETFRPAPNPKLRMNVAGTQTKTAVVLFTSVVALV